MSYYWQCQYYAYSSPYHIVFIFTQCLFKRSISVTCFRWIPKFVNVTVFISFVVSVYLWRHYYDYMYTIVIYLISCLVMLFIMVCYIIVLLSSPLSSSHHLSLKRSVNPKTHFGSDTYLCIPFYPYLCWYFQSMFLKLDRAFN